MDDMNWTLPPELESALEDFHAAPQPDPAFASRLDLELRRRFDEISLPLKVERMSFMQTLRARPLVAILVAILALLLLSGVAYAIGRLSGFIPGFGFTSDAGAVTVLKETVSAESNGITVSVEKAVSDRSRFWVEVNVRGLPEGQDFPAGQAFILLPSGEKIQVQMGNTNSDAGEMRMTYIFPALTGSPQRVTLLIENLGGEIFNLPLELRPIQAGEILPVPLTESAPLQSETHDGLTLVLDNVAPDKDKTVFQVSLRFDQEGVWLNSDWNVTLTDANGGVYPLTDITPDTLASSGTTKVYAAAPFNGSEQLILSLAAFPDSENLPMMKNFLLDEAGFAFDPGVNPQVGQTWQLDETVQAGRYTLHMAGARLTAPNELLFEFSPSGNVTGVMLYSSLASGSSGGVPMVEENFLAGMTFEKIPTQPFMVYVSNVYYTARGKWEIHWQPSASPAQASGLPTSTPLPTPALVATPTFASSDPLVLEAQSLAQKFDAPLQQGAGWVHVIWENVSENQQAGQVYPPPYYQDEQWYEVDADGWVLRTLTTHHDANGKVIQQAATIGNYSINFTTGDTFTDIQPYRFSLDMLTQSLAQAAQYNTQVLREETTCEDGSPCLLITLLDSFTQPIQNPGEAQAFGGSGNRTWINLQTGQQVKFESFYVLADGQERVDSTQRTLLAEKVVSPPQEVLDILGRVVVP
jgi:hypothetical protein